MWPLLRTLWRMFVIDGGLMKAGWLFNPVLLRNRQISMSKRSPGRCFR